MLPEQSLTVIIDVIRAFTMTHYALAVGVKEIYFADSIENARVLKNENPEYLLAGERHAKKIPGFDLGNSPAEIQRADVTGKSMILTTTNGVPTALHCLKFGGVLVTGYCGAKDTANYILAQGPRLEWEQVNIVASHPTGSEDLKCAEYILTLLTKASSEDCAEEVQSSIKNSMAAQKFYDPDKPEFDPKDIDLCCQVSATNQIMKLHPAEVPFLTRTLI